MRSRLIDFRRRATLFAADTFFESLSRAGRLHPLAAPERHGVEVIRDVAYAETGKIAHRLDVWRPRDAGRSRTAGGNREGDRPVGRVFRSGVLYVHGGGFRILSKDSHWIMALMFARAGYVVFNVNYRLAPKYPFPDGLQDVCDAAIWVAEHGAEYGADPSKLIFAGESAGANLVTALTLATSYARPEPWARAVFERGVTPAAVLPACGLLQVSDPERFLRRRPHLATVAHDQIVVISEEYLARRNELPSLDLADPLVALERGTPPDRPLPPFLMGSAARRRAPPRPRARVAGHALRVAHLPARAARVPRVRHDEERAPMLARYVRLPRRASGNGARGHGVTPYFV